MNRIHRWYCKSSLWAETMEQRLLPWVLGPVELGDNALEVGPGPGLATPLLRKRADKLTAIEIDPALATSLRNKMAASDVRVVEGDATDMPFPNACFSAAVSMTMLHHVPSPTLQDRLLQEVHRVLRPGAYFIGSDSLTSPLFQLVHLFDTLVPVDPKTFATRLTAAGFKNPEIETKKGTFRFRAQKAT